MSESVSLPKCTLKVIRARDFPASEPADDLVKRAGFKASVCAVVEVWHSRQERNSKHSPVHLQTYLKNAGLKAWIRAACFQSMGVKPVESNDAFLQELRDAAGAKATVLSSLGHVMIKMRTQYSVEMAASKMAASKWPHRNGHCLKAVAVTTASGLPALCWNACSAVALDWKQSRSIHVLSRKPGRHPDV